MRQPVTPGNLPNMNSDVVLLPHRIFKGVAYDAR